MTGVCAVVCAAGKGLRAGFSKNKLLLPYGGATVLERTIAAFVRDDVDEILVTCSENDRAEISAICAKFPRTRAVLGGETRSRSVYNALSATDAEIVLIHDGARPFVAQESVTDCLQSARRYGSGVCAVPCTDTVAVTDGERILSVPDRATLRQIQTPQGFRRAELLAAYERAFADASASFTDDSSVYAKYCAAPRICAGTRDNIKLTYAEDFREEYARCGFGVDTHAFGKPQNFILLGGVKIPSESGLIAHSDGDVLAHAVMDALLSAAGLKDIGHYFPDADEKWRGADSMQMLRTVTDMLRERGFRVKNLSVAMQAERPRLAKYIDDIRAALANALDIPLDAVGVSAGTNEGLGYVGEGKGITVNAYALLSAVAPPQNNA